MKHLGRIIPSEHNQFAPYLIPCNHDYKYKLLKGEWTIADDGYGSDNVVTAVPMVHYSGDTYRGKCPVCDQEYEAATKINKAFYNPPQP